MPDMNNIKKCTRCGEYKINTLEFFGCGNRSRALKSGRPKRDSSKELELDARCRKCKADAQRIYDKNHRLEILEKRKIHYVKNREKILEERKVYYKENKEAIMAYRLEYENYKYSTDPVFRYRKSVRTRIRDFYKGRVKSKKSQELIGCTWEELAKHLEDQFSSGMTHENHGEWHIDHIRPLSSFDPSSPEDEKIANHYTNLQPLWASDNLSKGSTWRKESTC